MRKYIRAAARRLTKSLIAAGVMATPDETIYDSWRDGRLDALADALESHRRTRARIAEVTKKD